MQKRHFIVIFPHMLIMPFDHIYHLLPAGGGCERQRNGQQRWVHVPWGLMPRVSQPGAQLAAASATSHHRLPALPGCHGQELPPSPRSGCRHCPPGPPPRLLLLCRRHRRGLLRGPGPVPHAPAAGLARGPRVVTCAPCARGPLAPGFSCVAEEGEKPTRRAQPSQARSPDGAAAGVVRAPTEP
jgi:hypothetical protein